MRELADDPDCDIAEEYGQIYCGNRRTTKRVINELLSLTAIKCTYRDQIPSGGYTLYGINETGKALLRRPILADELSRALLKGERFTVIDDRVVLLADMQ